MARAKATHVRTGKVVAEDLEVQRSMLGRTAGLMFRRSLAPGAGMWIVPCNGIHMMFMNFAIDAVFLDRDNRVKKVYPRLHAWWGVVWVVWKLVPRTRPGAIAFTRIPCGPSSDASERVKVRTAPLAVE